MAKNDAKDYNPDSILTPDYEPMRFDEIEDDDLFWRCHLEGYANQTHLNYKKELSEFISFNGKNLQSILFVSLLIFKNKQILCFRY